MCRNERSVTHDDVDQVMQNQSIGGYVFKAERRRYCERYCFDFRSLFFSV